VQNLDLQSLPPIDIFAYGFPCNDFSIVGERKGSQGKFGGLYQAGVAVLNHHQPLAFVAENVGGIGSADEGRLFRRILEGLATAGKGYHLTVHLYKAEQYGVPQTRHRYFIVGIAQDLGLHFRVPSPTHPLPITASQALANIPPNAPNHEPKRVSARVVERLQHIQPGENAWTADLPDHLRLNVKTAKLSQIYKRLAPDKPAYTLTGSGGGGTHGYHYAEPRPLTNRERARLQTFPDDFIFYGSPEEVRRQIGMAVPPRLAQVIFQALLATLAGQSYPYIPANYNYPTLTVHQKDLL
jgi:DNA (cytosine-5)-methyltransferase 1